MPGQGPAVAGGVGAPQLEGGGADDDTNAAASALTSVVLERPRPAARMARPRASADPWTGGGRRSLTESLLLPDPEELAELGRSITERVLEYSDRIDPSLRPEGAAPVQAVLVGFPLPPTTTGN